MKIKRLTVENLTSLKGLHEVDFQSQLFGADLFAITGPTGSGKSSLLNAISLALYAKSAKSDLSSQDFVATGTPKARVRLEFEHMKTDYLATWSCRKLGKNNKRLKRADVQRQFFYFDRKKREWGPLAQTPEEVLQLSYEQFTRSVVLNQGEFARFLTSNFTDRRQILERLYSGENLQSLKTLLNEKLKSSQSQMQLLEQKELGLMPFGQEQYEQFKRQIEKLKNEENQLQHSSNITGKLTSEFERLWDVVQQDDSTQSKLAQLENLLSEQTQTANQCKQTQHLLEQALEKSTLHYKKLKPLLEEIHQNAQQVAQKKQTAFELEQRLQQISTQEQEKTTQLEKMQGQAKSYESELTKLEQMLPLNLQNKSTEQKNEIHGQLKSFLKQARELKTQYNTQAQEQKLAQNEIDLKQKELKEHKEELATLQKERNQHKHKLQAQLSPFKSLDQLQEQWQKAQSDLKELKAKQQTFQELEQDHKKNQDLAQELKREQETRKTELQKKEEQIQQIEQWKELNELQASLESCIKKSLQDGECFVCGHEVSQKILEHPLLKNNYSPDLVKLNDLKKIQQDEQKDLQKGNLKLEDLKAKKEQYLQSQQRIREEATQICTPWSIHHKNDNWEVTQKELEKTVLDLKEKFNQTQGLTQKGHQLEARRETLNQTICQLETEIKSRDKRQEELKSQLSKTQKKMHSAREDIQFLDFSKSFSLEDFENSAETIKEICAKEYSKQQLVNYTQQVSTELKTLAKDRRQETDKKTQLKREIQQLHEKCDRILEDELFDKERDSYKNNPARPREKREELEKEIEQCQARLNMNTQEVQTTEQQLNHTRGQLSLQKERLKELSDLFTIHRTKMLALFDDLQGYTQALDVKNHWPQKFSSLELAHLTGHHKDALWAFYEDKLQPISENLVDQLNLTRQKIQENRAQVELYQSRLKDKDQLHKESQQLSQKIEGLEKLHSLIGKDEFRNFALAMIERDLIRQTNLELEKICQGRYRIDFASTAKAQEFSLIDYWQGAQQRKISTLSGGETFLVSLAMALSLAEMSRGETEINSFFIDEGFGSLDQDSLEEVIETLSHIRSRGKQIGIISHVKELTQRIDVNIDLIKNQHGESHIQVIHN